MLYLASQFAWFLLAAFVLGFVMARLGHDGGKLQVWSRATILVVGLWALGAAATWLQMLNGAPALWVETALLFTAVYVAGCLAATASRPASGDAVAAAATMSLPPAAAQAASLAVPSSPRIVAESKSVVVDAAADLADSPLAKVDGQDDLSGERPQGLAAARSGTPDDLKLIKGIGRQNEGRLHGLGIWHFDQIAAWTAENIEWVGGYLAFPGRIEREDWVGQARALAAGVETEFARRAKAGEVASSRDDGSQGQDNVATLADGEFDGEKPTNLCQAPRAGGADDLTLIRGVGPAIAADLNRLGIWHFDQIAALREPEIRYLCGFADVAATAGVSWREDADILRHGGETAHSRTVKAGRQTPRS